MTSDTRVPTSVEGGSSYRWVVCGLLFVATTINYIDRQILGILAPVLEREIGWTEAEYGLIVTAFQASYAGGLLAFGRILDVTGTRFGYAFSVGIWSIAAATHGAVSSVWGFGLARLALGFGEAGNFPAAIKTVSDWFAPKDRSLAIGLFNSGANVGAVVTPILVPWITLRYGWRMAFLVTGGIAFVWIGAWLAAYRRGSESSTAVEAAVVPWAALLRVRETWTFVVARFLTDPVWWFYLYWTPKFLYTRYGLGLDEMGLPLMVIYTAASAGGILGGWMSTQMMRRGWSANQARKLAILVCALLVFPMVFVAVVPDLWAAVLIISMAAAGHQGWASNMFACLADLFPRSAVSSVVGITGFGGSVGGMIAATATGYLLQATGSYAPLFVWAGCSYFLILGLIHVMIPRIRPVEFPER